VASTFKNQGAALGVTDSGSFYTAPGGTYAVIHALYISNHETSEAISVNVKVTTDGGSTFYHVGKGLNVPANNTLVLDKPINLEPSDIIRIYADVLADSSTPTAEVVASILEVT
tara:strand:- start:149 stop:490 length:342 start_codon:yes stop_codon:yes gene_type:complete